MSYVDEVYERVVAQKAEKDEKSCRSRKKNGNMEVESLIHM